MASRLSRRDVGRVSRGAGAGDAWVAELSISYDGGPPSYGVSILELRDEKIARESIYVAQGWDAPEWRAR
ncbi:MAG TPA: hypothetical protein VJ807_02610, partial [Gaiellaceae bacterium]|nr:hypothetical protein [Gaiellaceae bacterium]